MKFRLIFKSGLSVVATVEGERDVTEKELTDLTRRRRQDDTLSSLGGRVPQIEADLERLLGYRVHVEQVR